MVQVSKLADVMGHFRQVLEPFLTDGAQSHLQLEIGDHGTKVGVPTPFSITVDRTLHMRRALLYGGYSVGNRHLAIIVSMNPQGPLDMFASCLKTFTNVGGQRAAIRVA